MNDEKNKECMFEWKNEFRICLLTGVSAILIFCVLSHIWNMDLNVPLSYSGDVSGGLILIKTVLREESWWNFDGLGAPFYTNIWRMLLDGGIPWIIMFVIAKVTKSVGYGINIYYILSYGLYGNCTYYMLRKMGIQKRFSFIGAILFSLIPGHYIRGEGHLLVGSCFAIPLIIVVAMNLYTGKMCKPEYVSKEKLTGKELIASNSREQNLGLLFLIIVTFCTLYYGIFSLMLLTFCAVYCAVTQKQLRHLYYYLQYVLAEIICLVIIYLPQIMANIFDPCVEKVEIITRTLADVEWYGGKLIQYILPVMGHRISFLAELRALYDTTFPLVTENGMASLGMIMSIGFLTALVTCFFPRERYLSRYEMYGKMELFLFLVSTVGGLGVIVGFINYSLRCYNRFSYFIGAVGIIVSMRLLQDFCLWMENRKSAGKVSSYLLCVLILGIGIYDQTTVGMQYSKEYGDYSRRLYYDDAEFVRAIELYEGNNAKILVFPVMNGQQSTIGITKEGVQTSYNEQVLFIHSDTSDWSVRGQAGENGERWLNWLENFSVEAQIEVAAIVGFSGVAVYYGGYEAEQLSVQLSKLEEKTGSPTIIHNSGTWAYYSLDKVRDAMKEKYSAEQLKELKEKYLYDCSSVAEYNADNLYTTSEMQGAEGIILTKGTCQYGPYSKFNAGSYTVEIFGNHLDEARFDCYCNAGDTCFGINMQEVTSDYVKYDVQFEVDIDPVEFRTFNDGDTEVTVNKIKVERVTK